MEVGAPKDGRHDQGRQLQRAHHEGDRQVPEHQQRPGDGSGQQLPPSAAVAVDDDPQAGEHAAERDEQADRADGHVSLVVEAVAETDHLGQRRRDDHGEQDRG